MSQRENPVYSDDTDVVPETVVLTYEHYLKLRRSHAQVRRLNDFLRDLDGYESLRDEIRAELQQAKVWYA